MKFVLESSMKSNVNSLIITLDLDWACEAAIELTLDFLLQRGIKPCVFTTHESPIVSQVMTKLDVGIHPYFGNDSSHGRTIAEVVETTLSLPHNLPAFRCHRFAVCNASMLALHEAGMLISSNVCTDLAVIPPFVNRFGLLEMPIFLEDGGYLWRRHSLTVDEKLENGLNNEGLKVLLIHPMHFAINSPNFEYMVDIKKTMSRKDWNTLSARHLEQLTWRQRGIRDLLIDIIEQGVGILSLSDFLVDAHAGVITM